MTGDGCKTGKLKGAYCKPVRLSTFAGKRRSRDQHETRQLRKTKALAYFFISRCCFSGI